MKSVPILMLSLLILSVAVNAQKIPVNKAISVQTVIVDVNGNKLRPFSDDGQKATVFFFVSQDCPITNNYAPEICRICDQYKTRGVTFYMVYPDQTVSAKTVKQHAFSHKFTCPSLLDRSHALVATLHATITPEAVVVSSKREILYEGRIDDRYETYGKMRTVITSSDLRDALDAILEGKPVARPKTTPLGCFI